MSKKGLPDGLKMRHDWHYVEELAKTPRLVGRMIALDKIDPNPEQPRTELGDLSDLSASIKDRGVLEPLLVKPLSKQQNSQRWMIIAGERRWRAARLAGLEEVPCIELDVDSAQIAEIALIENLQRKDLSVWEEAEGLAALSQRFGYTHEDVAKRIGKSRSTVTESLTIASLPQNIKDKCRQSKINSKSAILQIARQFDETAMLSAIKVYEDSLNLALKVSDSGNNHAANQKSDLNNVNSSDETLPTGSKRKLSSEMGEPASNQSKQYKPTALDLSHQTNLSSPVRTYAYQPPEGEYKLALKFKRPVEKSDIIVALRKILAELEQN